MKETREILAFGQGPVLPEEPRKNIKLATTSSLNGALNWWGSELSAAGSELTQRGYSRFRIMGGQTAGPDYASEADLVGEGILGNREVLGEKGSTNTLENLVNVCNEQLDPDDPRAEPRRDAQDILGASFHLTRMKLLMNIFAIPYDRVIGADSMMRYAAMEAGDEAVLLDIQQRHDINAANRHPNVVGRGDIDPENTRVINLAEDTVEKKAKAQKKDLGYYTQRDDPELKTYAEKKQEEDVWTRALLTIPEYSMKYFGHIHNDQRLREVLYNFNDLFPDTADELGALARYDISLKDVGNDNLHTVRMKLQSISRLMPNDFLPEKLRIAAERGVPFDEVDVIKVWKEEHSQKGWPEDVEEKFQRLLHATA